MRIKSILNILTAVSFVGAISCTAITIPKVSEISDTNRVYSDTKQKYESSVKSAINAENNFTSNRTFELYYNDVDGILELLDNVSGMNVAEVKVLDAENGFNEVGVYEKGTQANALRIHLVVNNIDVALKSIEKAQFAIYNIECKTPSDIIIDIITKGVSE